MSNSVLFRLFAAAGKSESLKMQTFKQFARLCTNVYLNLPLWIS